MPARVRHRQVGEIGLDVEERGPGNVRGEVELAALAGRTELPAAVDDHVPHAPEPIGGLRSVARGE